MTMADSDLKRTLTGLRSRLGLDSLSARERLILLAGLVFVGAVLAYQLVVSPYLVAHDRLQKSLARKQQELVEIATLSREYAELRREEGGMKAVLAKREAGFTLFAFLDQQAEIAGVKAQIKYMKPSVADADEGFRESSVEMRLEGVALERLTEFLRLTEADDKVVSVRRLSIQASSREEGGLDVVLQIVTLVTVG